jgi:hypothetical protein
LITVKLFLVSNDILLMMQVIGLAPESLFDD